MGKSALQENEASPIFDIQLEKLFFCGILENGFFLANHVSNWKTSALAVSHVFLQLGTSLESDLSLKVLVLAVLLGT